MSIDEMMIDLKKRIALNTLAKNFRNVVYTESQDKLYPNATTKESILAGENLNLYKPDKLNVISMNADDNYDGDAKRNLEVLMSISDAENVLGKLTISEKKQFNIFFNKFKEGLAGVQFVSSDDFIIYLRNYLYRSIGGTFTKPTKQQPQTPANPIKQQPQTPPATPPATPQQAPQTPYSRAIFDKFVTELNDILALPATIPITIPTKRKYDEIEKYLHRADGNALSDILFNLQQSVLGSKHSHVVPQGQQSDKKTAFIIQVVIPQIITFLQGLRAGAGLKKKRNTTIKYGKGLKKAHHFIKNHLYIDVNKLNENILSIKYVRNNNKKTELAMTDNTKLVMLQLLTDNFNASTFAKLTSQEKKTISYVNSIFEFVDSKYFPEDPIADLYQRFNILKGQIIASNDNPDIVKEMKLVAFELHKYKKISSSQLRNLIFELSN